MSSKVSKAQRRAQQAEFNRQLWAEAYASRLQSNYNVWRTNHILTDDYSRLENPHKRFTSWNPAPTSLSSKNINPR